MQMAADFCVIYDTKTCVIYGQNVIYDKNTKGKYGQNGQNHEIIKQTNIYKTKLSSKIRNTYSQMSLNKKKPINRKTARMCSEYDGKNTDDQHTAWQGQRGDYGRQKIDKYRIKGTSKTYIRPLSFSQYNVSLSLSLSYT